MRLKIESAGQPQPGQDLEDLWIDVTDHVTGDNADLLLAAWRWANEGQVVRVTLDPRPVV